MRREQEAVDQPSEAQRRLVQALRDPACYPHPSGAYRSSRPTSRSSSWPEPSPTRSRSRSTSGFFRLHRIQPGLALNRCDQRSRVPGHGPPCSQSRRPRQTISEHLSRILPRLWRFAPWRSVRRGFIETSDELHAQIPPGSSLLSITGQDFSYRLAGASVLIPFILG